MHQAQVKETEDVVLEFGSFRLDLSKRVLTDSGKQLRLGSRAFDLLAVLAGRPGEVLSNAELVELVWPDVFVEDGNLRVHLTGLRKALRDGQDGNRYILNIPGRGYNFVAEVRRTYSRPAVPETHVESQGPEAGVAPLALPALISGVIGREQTAAELMESIRRRRLVTIVGPGGIGKTTTAVHVASDPANDAAFVDLSLVTSGELFAAHVAQALGLQSRSAATMKGLAEAIGDRRLLLVLDNCEHVVEAAAAFAEKLLGETPNLRILATSREALRAEGEWTHRLAALGMPDAGAAIGFAEAMTYPAIRLFVERATAADRNLSISDIDVPVVVDICRSLDGIPLAIELAAARTDVFGLKGLLARLDNRFSVLNKGRRTALPRQQTLRATLDWSYDALEPMEQVALGRLSVFAGPFSLDWALAVAAFGELDDSGLIEAISSLVSKSLVNVDISNEEVLYRLLETTRAYAAEKLSATSEAGATRRRHGAYFETVAKGAEREWGAAPHQRWVSHHAPAMVEIRAALGWAFTDDGDAPLGLSMLASSAPMWFQLNLTDQYRQRVDAAVDRFPLLDTVPDGKRTEMKLWLTLAHARWHTYGSVPEVADAFGRALRLAEELGDVEYRLKALWGAWTDRVSQADYATAMQMAETYSALCEASGDVHAEIVRHRLMALSLIHAGDPRRALHHAEAIMSSPTILLRPDHNSGYQFDQRAVGHSHLARLLWILGYPDQAWDHAVKGVNHGLDIRHELSLCFITAIGAGCTALWSGADNRLAEYTALLRETANRNGYVYWAQWAQCFDAVIAERARRGASASGGVLDSAGVPDLPYQHMEVAGTAGLWPLDARILPRLESDPPGFCTAEHIRVRGQLRLERGDPAGATGDFQRAFELAETQGTKSWQLRAAMSLVDVAERGSPRDQALERLGSVLGWFTEGADTADHIRARRLLSSA